MRKTAGLSHKRQRRIGIYSGTFDPVHAGHVGFALQAIETAKLDIVYFLPERRPRYKQGVEHFAHRVAMLRRACRPHPKLDVLELEDVNFSIERTLPRLQKRLGKSQLVFLFGSDVAAHLPNWPQVESLLASSELVIGVRAEDNLARVSEQIRAWPQQPKALKIFESYAADVSSGAVRKAIRERRHARGLLPSVAHYSDRHWLYVSLT